jgi:hypothetical protein
MRKTARIALVLLGLTIGCSADKTPTAPEAGGLNLTGTWNGPIVVDTTEARMSWNLTQLNGVVSGPVTVLLPNGIVLLNGFLNGTLSGKTLTYTISVGNGGVPTRPTCTGQLTGTMTVTVASPRRSTVRWACRRATARRPSARPPLPHTAVATEATKARKHEEDLLVFFVLVS